MAITLMLTLFLLLAAAITVGAMDYRRVPAHARRAPQRAGRIG